METSWIASEPGRRLPGVRYAHRRPWWSRAFFSPRAARLAPLLAWVAERAWRGIGRAAEPFQPEAVLTVAHGFNWLGVSAWSRRQAIPLHLVIHDDWPRLRAWGARASAKLDPVFAGHYREAASRLCVSPFMEQSYRRRYGAAGRVLYPARDAALPVARETDPGISQPLPRLTAAFAGTLHPGYEKPLSLMARALESSGGRLLMFGPMNATDLRQAGLAGAAVECRGMLEAGALQKALRREANVLYAPMSFEEDDRANTEASFPSKLADYTACGLPVLVHGPPWSSAVRWARENPSAALAVESADPAVLSASLARLQGDPALRERLAQGAIEAGARDFSPEAASRTFRECVAAKASDSLAF